MGPLGRRIGAALVAVGVLAAVLGGCGDDGEDVPTIAILRAVAGSESELAFLPALEQHAFGPDRVEILGADPTDVRSDRADAEAAVRGWLQQGVDLIVALSTSSAEAAAAVTDEVPILFLVNDPSTAQLVDDERAPEGNLTGATYRVPADRTVTLAQSLVGELERVGCVYPEDDPGALAVREELVRGAAALGVDLECATFGAEVAVAEAVAHLAEAGIDVLIPLNSPGTVDAFAEIEAALVGTTIPVITTTPWEAAVLTLVPDGQMLYRQLAAQAARLLDGDAVGDIPVEDPARYRSVVNLRAAAAIGLRVPEAIIEQADEVVR